MRTFLILLLSLCSAAALAARAPVDVINAYHGALIDAMKRGGTQNCQARGKRLQPAIESAIDLPYVSQLVLKKHWDELGDAQKTQFKAAFEELVVATYASQFKSFGGESFTVLETRDAPGGNKLVRAQLDTGDSKVSFDYYLHPFAGDSWKVINVVADGVSDLALRSTQYDLALREKGFDGLIAGIQDQKKKTLAACS